MAIRNHVAESRREVLAFPTSWKSSWVRILISLAAGLAGFLLVAGLVSAGNGAPQPHVPPPGGVLGVLGQSGPTGPGGRCGDGVCDPNETCASCTTDCCPPEETEPPTQPPSEECDNDGVCEPPGEGTYNCGDCPSVCGDGICAAHEVDNCCGPGKDCTVQITCGDGICSACEDTASCPTDCQGITPTVPTVTNTSVPTATFTLPPPPGVTVTRTSTPGEPTETSTPRPTATRRPTATAVTGTPTPTPEPEADCGLVPYESRPDGWQGAYGDAVSPDGFIPVRADDLEVWVCPVPPSGERLCIPIYDGLLESVNSDLTKINLADCPDAGPCRIFQQVGEMDGEQLCFVVGDAGLDPSCEIGCALIPQQQQEAGLPPWALPLGLLLLLLLLLLIIILLLTRRRREEEEEEGTAA